MKKYLIVGAVVIVIILVIIFQDKIKALFAQNTNTAQATQGGSAAGASGAAAVATTLNYDKLLKKGSTGAEVKKLQEWLQVKADGKFGPITENALQANKCVKEITLGQYNQIQCPASNTPVAENTTDNTPWYQSITFDYFSLFS